MNDIISSKLNLVKSSVTDTKIKQIKSKVKQNNNDNTFEKMLKFENNNNQNNKIIKNKFNKQEKKLYDSCIELESFLWKQVLNSMKKTTGKFKMIDGGQAEEIFSDLLYDEYSMILAKNSDTGIADSMFNQLKENL